MASVTIKGKAAVEGIAGTIDLVVYPVSQTGKVRQEWAEEIIQDVHGFDTTWLARNEHRLMDFGFKLLGDTAAHAAAGGAFIAAYATVTLSGFTLSEFNGTYQNISGGELDLANIKVGDFATKFRKYADSTQNTLSQTTPS